MTTVKKKYTAATARRLTRASLAARDGRRHARQQYGTDSEEFSRAYDLATEADRELMGFILEATKRTVPTEVKNAYDVDDFVPAAMTIDGTLWMVCFDPADCSFDSPHMFSVRLVDALSL